MPKPNYEYEELETEEEVEKAFGAQKTFISKLGYLLNFIARNDMMQNANDYLTEDELRSNGMFVKYSYNDPQNGNTWQNMSEQQSKIEGNLTNKVLKEIMDNYVGQAPTIEGFRRIYELMHIYKTQPYIEAGKRYDKVKDIIEGYGLQGTEEEIEYKKNWLAHRSMPDISAGFNASSMNFGNMVMKLEKDYSMISYLKQRLTECVDKCNVGQFLDVFQIYDENVRAQMMEQYHCDAKTPLKDIVNKKIGERTLGKATIIQDIQNAWGLQGKNKVINSISDKDKQYLLVGEKILNTEQDEKYKKWFKNEGNAFGDTLYKMNLIPTFKAVNKSIKSTKPIVTVKLSRTVEESQKRYEAGLVYTNYKDNVFDLEKGFLNPAGAAIEMRGPKHKLEESAEKEEYDALQVELPEGIDEEMYTAIMYGATVELVDKADGTFKTVANYLGNTTIALEAKKNAIAAINAFKEGNPVPAREYVNKFIDQLNSTVSFDAVYNDIPTSRSSEIISDEKTMFMLAQRVKGKEPLKATGTEITLDSVKADVYQKELSAFGMAAKRKAQILRTNNDINSKKLKEELVSDIIFYEYIASIGNAERARIENEAQKILDASLAEMGIVKGGDPDYYTDIVETVAYSEYFKDVKNNLKSTTISDIQTILAEENGIETLKNLYLPEIKKSDNYKKILRAKNEKELIDALEMLDIKMENVSAKGDEFFPAVKLPQKEIKTKKIVLDENKKKKFVDTTELKGASYELNEKMKNLHAGGIQKITDKFKKLVNKYHKSVKNYENSRFTSNSVDALAANKETIDTLYATIDSVDNWRGTGANFAAMKKALKNLQTYTSEMVAANKPANNAAMKKYIDLATEVLTLARKYVKEKTKINSDYAQKRVNAVNNLIRELGINIPSAQETKEKILAREAKQAGAGDIMNIRKLKQTYGENTKTNGIYDGNKYYVLSIQEANSYSINKWAGQSISVMALIAEGYKFEDIMDDTKLKDIKRRMFDTVIKKCSNKTPENQKWIADKIYKGLTASNEIIDKELEGVYFGDPDFETDPQFNKVQQFAAYVHDAWREMKHCQNEIMEIAKNDHPELATYADFKAYHGKRSSYLDEFKSKQVEFAGAVEDYLDKGATQANSVLLVEKSFGYHMEKRILLKYATKQGKFSERFKDTNEKTEIKNVLAEANVEGQKKLQDIFKDCPELAEKYQKSLMNGSFFDSISYTFNKDTQKYTMNGYTELNQKLEKEGFEINYQKAMGRLEKGVYSDKNAFIRDAAFAFAGQMEKLNIAIPADHNTGKVYTYSEFANILMKDPSFKNMLMNPNDPKKIRNPKKVAEMVKDPEVMKNIAKISKKQYNAKQPANQNNKEMEQNQSKNLMGPN